MSPPRNAPFPGQLLPCPTCGHAWLYHDAGSKNGCTKCKLCDEASCIPITAPRPEAVELATKLLAITGLDAKKVPTETAVWSALIDAALTAAREEQREKDARVCDERAHSWGAINLDITTDARARDYIKEREALYCARAIREGR